MIKLNKVECHKLNNLRQKYIDSNISTTSKNMVPEKETNAINAYKLYADYLFSLGQKYGFKVADIDTIYDDGEVEFKKGTIQSAAPLITEVKTETNLQEAIIQTATTPGLKMELPGSKFFILTGVRIMKYFRDETQDFQCPNCDKIFKTPDDFMSHIRSSELKENDIGNYVLKTRLESIS